METFRQKFTGQILTPGDAEYERSRSVWNGAINRRPAVIAKCTTTAQVSEAVQLARRSGLELAVRGGGHNYAGHAVCEGGLMIHLGAMKDVTVDGGARRATCGGGATWADLDGATQKHGLATPGGFVSHTGVGGLTLGGGIGWLTKKAGLTCDNLVSAEIVVADGRIVRASATENPELFWALRGGGGNFGVITSFEFALHPVGPTVNLGLFFFGLDQGPEALRLGRDVVKTLPEEATAFLAIGLSAPRAPFVPPAFHLRPGHALLVVGFGSPAEHAAVVAPIRKALTPLFELVTPIPYLALQQMFNESAAWGSFAYEKALYLDSLSDTAIAVIGEHLPRKTSPLTFLPTFTLDGKYRSVGENDTAFGGSRSAAFVLNIQTASPTRELYEADRAWIRNLWDALRPHARGTGSYVNFLPEGETEDRIKASYGDKYARLVRIKSEWDPGNLFHLNANIKPA
jgi:FAD/FMN-containing dehydrogenase